jgi:hypothetical protein
MGSNGRVAISTIQNESIVVEKEKGEQKKAEKAQVTILDND